jgi:uncharacterized protein (TIRG00374 family)
MQNHRITPMQQLVPSLILGVLAILGLLLLAGMNKVSQNFLDFDWGFFGLALGLAFFGNTLRFLKRAIALRISGIKGLNLFDSVQLFMASLPLDAAPSRIGDSYKSLWLFKIAGLPTIRSSSVYLLEQLSDNLSIFVLTALGVIAYPSFWPLFVLVLLLFLIVTLFLRIKHKDSEMAELNERLPVYKQLFQDLRFCIDGHPALFSSGHLATTLFLGVVSRAAEGAVLFFILCGLGMTPSLPLAAASVLVYAFTASIANITSIPGGMGVVEASMALMMTMLFNFQPGVAVTATLLFRLATFWINLGVGLLIWSVSGKKLGLISGDGQIVKG